MNKRGTIEKGIGKEKKKRKRKKRIEKKTKEMKRNEMKRNEKKLYQHFVIYFVYFAPNMDFAISCEGSV